MVVLVIVLVVTNLATLGALAYAVLRRDDPPGPDSHVAAALDRAPHPPAAAGVTRRLITIEILNPIELAATKGRLIGIAGSLAPGLTRRIVYDQTLKILKKQLVEQQVVADVRIHTLAPPVPPAPSPGRPGPPTPPAPRRRSVPPVSEPRRPADVRPAAAGRPVDTPPAEPVDLTKIDDRGR